MIARQSWGLGLAKRQGPMRIVDAPLPWRSEKDRA
jgi:hypothetical protein